MLNISLTVQDDLLNDENVSCNESTLFAIDTEVPTLCIKILYVDILWENVSDILCRLIYTQRKENICLWGTILNLKSRL